MLNYIAILWVRFWVFGPWSEGGFQLSKPFPKGAWLPRLTDFAKVIPDFGGLTVHLGFLIGLVCAFLVWFLLKRTRKGYEIRLIGDNPRAARYAGINIGRNIILVMLMSGGLAGLAGMSEVAGSVHRLQDGVSSGYGFTGVIIAYLARFNPFGVVLASILLRRAHPGRARDPTGRHPGHDPGHRPVLRHLQRHPGAQPDPAWSAGELRDRSSRRVLRAARSCCSRPSARSSRSDPGSSTWASRA